MEISERTVDPIDIKREVSFGKRRAFSTMQRGHRSNQGRDEKLGREGQHKFCLSLGREGSGITKDKTLS